MDNQHLPELFKGQFIGMFDMNGRPMHEGDSVLFYYKGEFVICKIIYVPGLGYVLPSMAGWI